MKSKNIANAIGELLDDFFLIQKDINQVSNLYSVVIKEVEVAMIRKVMNWASRNKTQAAKILGISRNTLTKKIQDLQMDIATDEKGQPLEVIIDGDENGATISIGNKNDGNNKRICFIVSLENKIKLT